MFSLRDLINSQSQASVLTPAVDQNEEYNDYLKESDVSDVNQRYSSASSGYYHNTGYSDDIYTQTMGYSDNEIDPPIESSVNKVKSTRKVEFDRHTITKESKPRKSLLRRPEDFDDQFVDLFEDDQDKEGKIKNRK